MVELVVDGRIGELIITGGENVWPQAVEAVLSGHPAVRDVAVAGRPDAEWGEVVVAYVVAGDDPPSLDELRDHVKASLPAYNAPRVLVLVDEVPRTALGKIVRTKFDRPGIVKSPVGSCRRVINVLDAGQRTASHPGGP